MFPRYVAELIRNLQPGYVETTYCAVNRNASLAQNAAHLIAIATFETDDRSDVEAGR